MSEVILSGQLCSNGDKNILFGICSIEYVNLHLLVSYDMFHVMLSYLVKVLQAMDFPTRFIDWI